MVSLGQIVGESLKVLLILGVLVIIFDPTEEGLFLQSIIDLSYIFGGFILLVTFFLQDLSAWCGASLSYKTILWDDIGEIITSYLGLFVGGILVILGLIGSYSGLLIWEILEAPFNFLQSLIEGGTEFSPSDPFLNIITVTIDPLDLYFAISLSGSVGFQEFKAANWLTQHLEKHGFTTEKNICELSTAFRASYGHSEPSIAFLGEYDA